MEGKESGCEGRGNRKGRERSKGKGGMEELGGEGKVRKSVLANKNLRLHPCL